MSRTANLPRSARPRAPRARASSAALLAVAGLALAGCAAGQVSQTANQVAAIDGANAAVGSVGVLNARLASPEGAFFEPGDSTQVLLWISNDGLEDDTLSAVTTPAAESVEIDGEAVVPGKTLIDLSTSEGVRVELVGITDPLYYGQSIPITFSFAAAGDLTVNVPIENPTERSEDRETLEILPPHPVPLWEERIAEGEGHGGEGEGHGGEGGGEGETEGQNVGTQADGPGGTETADALDTGEADAEGTATAESGPAAETTG